VDVNVLLHQGCETRSYMLLSLLSSVASANPTVRIPSRLFPHLTLTAERYCNPAAELIGVMLRWWHTNCISSIAPSVPNQSAPSITTKQGMAMQSTQYCTSVHVQLCPVLGDGAATGGLPAHEHLIRVDQVVVRR
jgi:hypothetical protein